MTGTVRNTVRQQAGAVAPSPAVLWTPEELNVSIWLNDDGIELDGSNVESWHNRGSLGGYYYNHDASAPIVAAAELNGKNVVEMYSSSDYLNGSAVLNAALNDRAQWWCAYLYNCRAAGAADEVLFHFSENGGTGSRWSILASSTGNQYKSRFGGRRTDGGTWGSRSTSLAYGPDVWVMMLGIADFQNRTIAQYVNGEHDGTDSDEWEVGSANSPASDSLGVRSGQYTSGTSGLDGYIAEMFCGHDSVPTSDEIDQIFGYLAHQWGLTSLLDAGHPYKSDPPYA